MGIDGLEKLIGDDDEIPSLEALAKLVRATLKPEDYLPWRANGAAAIIRTCTVIEKYPEYSHITDSQIGWVVRRVGELVTDL